MVYHNKANRLIVYDLQKVMDGTMGPVSGKMINWNLVLAGTDELALDTVALEIDKVKADIIPHIREARKRGLGVVNIKDIEIVELPLAETKRSTPKFKIPGKK